MIPFQIKDIEQYFHVVLFIMLYKVVLTFESVDKILKCDHSNESYWAVLSCGAVYYAVQGGSHFWVCGWNPKVWPLKRKLLSRTFPRSCLLIVVLFIMLYKVVLTFETADEILKIDLWNVSFPEEFFSRYFAISSWSLPFWNSKEKFVLFNSLFAVKRFKMSYLHARNALLL